MNAESDERIKSEHPPFIYLVVHTDAKMFEKSNRSQKSHKAERA